MLIGLLSDAHGNPEGVRRCLAALRTAGAERIYFLGDAVGYLPGEIEVLRLLRDADVTCQRGNHEAMLLGDLALDPDRDSAYQLSAARERMSRTDRDFIGGWPDVREFTIDGRLVLLVHGSPRAHLEGYVYPDSELGWLAGLGYDAIFMGNTHRPFVRQLDGVLVANVGSCGLPRDQGDLPACAVYDSTAHTIEVLRTRVSSDAVLRQFAGPVHPIVFACLQRRVPQAVGRVVA